MRVDQRNSVIIRLQNAASMRQYSAGARGMERSALDAAISFLNFLSSADDALAVLSPKRTAWFRATFGEPTPIQIGSFPIVGRGHSVVLSAPTGTGKTLAAVLPLLD